MTWVKICGTTTLEDARLAVDAGADALGFIFAPGPRRISPRDAREIITELPEQVEKIGLFVNQSPEIILDTADTAGLTGIQLHGDENEQYISNLVSLATKHGRLQILKGLALARSADVDLESLKTCAGKIHALVMDSGSESKRGGTGERFDWPASRLLIKRLAQTFKIVIAGGLRPSNVGDAIELFQPWGVDVATGVEREPGKKDPQKVRDFIAAVRNAAVATSKTE